MAKLRKVVCMSIHVMHIHTYKQVSRVGGRGSGVGGRGSGGTSKAYYLISNFEFLEAKPRKGGNLNYRKGKFLSRGFFLKTKQKKRKKNKKVVSHL